MKIGWYDSDAIIQVPSNKLLEKTIPCTNFFKNQYEDWGKRLVRKSITLPPPKKKMRKK